MLVLLLYLLPFLLGIKENSGIHIECYNATALKITYNNTEIISACIPPRGYCNNIKKACDKRREPIFICTEDGIYPHIDDCEGSFLCSSKQRYDFSCPRGTVFDYTKSECKKKYIHHCERPKCLTKHGVFVTHPYDKRLYVYCIDGSAFSMGICPSDKIFSPAVERYPPCIFKCRNEGQFADLKNPQKYYKCTWDGKRFKLEEKVCYHGHTFKSPYGCVVTDKNSTTSSPSLPDKANSNPATSTRAAALNSNQNPSSNSTTTNVNSTPSSSTS